MKDNIEFREADSVELEALLRSDYDAERKNSETPAPLGAKPSSSTMKRQTPIPYLQICFTAIWRMSQSLSFIVIFPTINNMLVELGVADEIQVGKYSGLIEAAAAAGVCIGVFCFAPLSDKYGRKWVTILGVLAASILSGLFGFGQTFWQLMFLRFAMGYANGAQSATAKVMVSELTDKSNEAYSFALMGTGWQIGATAAPMIGALFSNPAKTFTSLRGGIFDRYPYALPPIVAAVIPGVACFFAICFAEETHPDIRSGKRRAGYGKLDQDSPSVFSKEAPIIEEEPSMFSCGAAFALFIRGLLIMQALWCGSCELLLFFSSQKIGGLGLTQAQMSIFLSARPLLVCFFTMFVCPWLFRTYNCVQVLRATVWLVPMYAALYLLLAYLAGIGFASPAVIVLILGIILVIQTACNPSYLATNVIINARAPTAAQLSRINSYCELCNQIAIALGASLGSASFAWSNEHHILPGKLSWLLLLALTLGQAIVTQKLTNRDGWRERAAQLEQ